MAKCKDGYIWFPPEKKCVPKAGTINSPYEQQKIGAIIAGSAIVGGVLGWLLREDVEDQKDADQYLDRLIKDHQLDQFVPEIRNLDWSVFTHTPEIINESILKEVELRYEDCETDEDVDSLIVDLEVLQNYIESQAINDGEYESVYDVVNHITEIQEALGGE